MIRRQSLLSLAVCLALAPVTMASSCKDKDKTDGDGTGEGNGTGNGTDVESTLQVISIDPAGAEPNQSFQGSIFGSGFAAEAEVYVGTIRIASVDRLDENSLQVTVPPLETGNYDVKVRNPNGQSSVLYGGLTVRVGASGRGGEAGAGGEGGEAEGAGTAVPPGVDCGRVVVTFGFDSSSLSEGARGTLGAAMGCFRGAGGTVTVEGHADERGTTQYNLALGQRRAEAVRSYLMAQGVPASGLRLVSYGEERPVDKGAGEAAWARNRRAEVKAPR